MSENIRQQTSSSRRGFLLGMTLAEVMLLILFTLLLLLGRQLPVDPGGPGPVPVKGPTSLPPQIAVIVKKMQQKPNEHWVVLTSREYNESEQAREETDKLKEALEQAMKEIAKLKEALQQATGKVKILQKELGQAQAGSPPPCIFEPGPGEKIRGSSIVLGTVYIKEDEISLISINREIPSIGAVDFLGRRVKYDMEAYKLISSWPEDKALSFNEFGELAQQIKDIGSRETDEKLKCLFTMNYYDEVGTSVDTFRSKFETYFLKQRKISIDELSNFRRN